MAGPDPGRASALRVVDGTSYPDWESVYAANAVAVYRLVYRQVGNAPDAEDLTEEVFLAALPRLRLPAAVHSVRAYLAATVRTVLAEHWRRHYAAPPTVAFADDLVADTLEPPEHDPDPRARRLLAPLPDRFRQILELRFLRGLSVRQAAAEMGVSAGNARVLQHRALRRAAELAAPDPAERTSDPGVPAESRWRDADSAGWDGAGSESSRWNPAKEPEP